MSASFQSDLPGEPRTEQQPLPTVAQVLDLPEVQAGAPEVIAGSRGLDREIRWAHVVAGAGAAELLDGGELALTTGAGWPHDARALRSLATSLTEAGGTGVAAIVLELGIGFTSAPSELVQACESRGVPLIVLHHEVRFVQITQRVHQRILSAQTEALQAREEVHNMLTELGLNRSPVDYVVERLAATLGCPVVLEDSAHQVVAVAVHGEDPVETLHPWNSDGEPKLPAASARVPVEARGNRWGYLTALPGPAHPAGRRTVLELGAFALALGRLADTSSDQWLQLASKRVFEALLSGRYRNDTELEAQLTAAGLPIEGRIILAATLRGTGDFGAHDSLAHAILETSLRRAVAPDGRVLITDDGEGALLTLISLPEGDPRLAWAEDRDAPMLAVRLARELDMLVPDTTPKAWRAHLALGAAGHRLGQLVASLEQLRAAGRLAPSSEVGRVTVQQAERQPLAHLIRSLAGAPELQQFSADMLAPLVEHDRISGPGHTGDLLVVLAAYTAHPTNRSLAAQKARLSRSVFYQRLDLIEQLLAVDLAEGETIAALTVALLARSR
ncbi:PucR family transcriptional regulator [Leucobacter sp. UT-8R-CII-1-4]|uniref:PucR family transcriptional regulator n=1 Tax=Leucobacter sp. UT-8R-CII-1-4 TaxID=3040075 RepID=UPI0024A992F6|nr:PucR family transcriptional regulator [Leucobacter sp. UT-8R-CII-1-4]MDI6022795.1 PucR family transcriptional regulator [Leucobacter sp. UT-8R-CII-1-4]